MYQQNGCEITTISQDTNGYTMLHTCDIHRGDSGSPLFRCYEEQCKIYGIVVAHRPIESESSEGRPTSYADKYKRKSSHFFHNIAVSSQSFSHCDLLE